MCINLGRYNKYAYLDEIELLNNEQTKVKTPHHDEAPLANPSTQHGEASYDGKLPVV